MRSICYCPVIQKQLLSICLNFTFLCPFSCQCFENGKVFSSFSFFQGCHPFSCATVFLQCLFECLQISSDINNHSERVIFSVWYNATMWRMPFVSLIVRASKFHVWVLLFFSLPWFGWKRLLLFEVPIFHFQSWNLMSFFCHETPIKEAF